MKVESKMVNLNTSSKTCGTAQAPDGPIDYGLLFKNSLQLVIILSPVCDDTGQVVDAQIIDTNPAFTEITGIRAATIKNGLASLLFGPLKGRNSIQKDFVAVANGARSRRREGYFSQFGRHFLYEIFPLNDELIALAAIDITPLKQAVQALRENQERLLETQEQALQRTAQVEIQHQLIESREAERLRIANQLHEGLLQGLIGILYAIEEGLDIDLKETRTARLAAVQATLQREIQNLRDYCNELRPPTLAPFGLEKTVRSYVEAFERKNLLPEIRLDLMPDRQLLPQGLRLVLFRAFQELFKNAVSRSNACLVTVRFALQPEQAELEIEDDGTAVDTPLQWAELGRQGQMGLASALERVEAVDGRIRIQVMPGMGTKVKVCVPIKSV